MIYVPPINILRFKLYRACPFLNSGTYGRGSGVPFKFGAAPHGHFQGKIRKSPRLALGAAVFPEMHRRRAASYHCTPSRISGLLTSAAQSPLLLPFQ